MSMAPIAKTFSMIYVEEADNNSCDMTVGHNDVMNGMSSIAEKLASYRNCLIAVILPKHPAFVSAILGILETKNCFVCCSSIEMANSYRSAAVSCIISTIATEDNQLSLNVHRLQIYFHHNGYYCLNEFGKDKICYLITTSGTLGERKEVLVPYSCIMPNIWDFSSRFQITSFDVILFATAATFDPFVVEILLAVVNGAKLLIVPDLFRSVPSKLATAIIKYGVTFIQMTPSQLKILPYNALAEICAGHSNVRTVILGGEPFPTNFIKRYHINDEFISFYNVYGVTEVSCWASCHKIDWKETRVEIGQPLLDTKFDVSETGELLIGGSRRCFINGKLSGTWFSTGDIVELTELGKIYWCDRSDDRQKINGINVSLSGLARKAEEYNGIQSAIALRRQQSVLLFVHVINAATMQSNLCKNLAVGLPLIIIHMDNWPVTGNGKVDRRKLMQIFEQKNLIFTMEDLYKLFESFNINLKNDQQMTFKDLGLDSSRAAELTLKTEHLLKQHNFPLLQYLLSDTGTVAGFLDALDFNQSMQEWHTIHMREIRIIPIENSINVKLLWEYDLGKCIDATPVVENGSIFLGSHSGRFVSLSLDGIKRWEVQLDGRIEATACCRGGIITVGSYDGYLYFLDEKSGELIWKFATGNVIKSTPVFIDAGNKCLFGSHDKCLYLLDIKNQKMVWKVLCDGSILSAPVLIGTTVLCATLRGEFLGIELGTGNILWKIQLAAPIFANLCVIGFNHHVLIANVKGLVTLCDTGSGHIINQYDIMESIFAAPTDTLQLLWHIRIDGIGSFPRPPEIPDNAEVSGETFGGVRILNMDKLDTSNSNDSSSSISNSNNKTTVLSYRALIGSRDDRIRCFHFSF
ncbi:Beta-alanine-activating enzyme [Dirofilaria immitis]